MLYSPSRVLTDREQASYYAVVSPGVKGEGTVQDFV